MKATMKAMVLDEPALPLAYRDIERPEPGDDEILVEVEACAVCRTDLHLVDGELLEPKLPLVIGHEIVGLVKSKGRLANQFELGERVGIPWLGKTCRHCPQCLAGRENLCLEPRFTGYTIDGGYAQYTTADARYCFKIPDTYSAVEAAPLLCAGLIGWRAYKMADSLFNLMPQTSRHEPSAAADQARSAPIVDCLNAAPQVVRELGIYGFGAAAHIITQVAVYQGKNVYGFTRCGDMAGQEFARRLGCVWSGDSDSLPPVPLDAAIIFAPVGGLLPLALKAVGRGGAVVCGGIHMSDIPGFPYGDLWMERKIASVANLTRIDALEFLDLAPMVPVRTQVSLYSLRDANQALDDLRSGRLSGAAVLVL